MMSREREPTQQEEEGVPAFAATQPNSPRHHRQSPPPPPKTSRPRKRVPAGNSAARFARRPARARRAGAPPEHGGPGERPAAEPGPGPGGRGPGRLRLPEVPGGPGGGRRGGPAAGRPHAAAGPLRPAAPGDVRARPPGRGRWIGGKWRTEGGWRVPPRPHGALAAPRWDARRLQPRRRRVAASREGEGVAPGG